MAKISLAAIKAIFETGDKPTQAQFADTWDSFFHKDDAVPPASVAGVEPIVLATTSTTASQAIGAGKMVTHIIVEVGSASQNMNVGTTANGSNIVDAEPLLPGTEVVIARDIYFKNAATLHFSQLSGTNTIKIYTR